MNTSIQTSTRQQCSFIREDCARVAQPIVDRFRPLWGSKLLITGASGFLGSWLAELVCYFNDVHQAGISLCLMDRDVERFYANLPHLVMAPYVEFIRCDMRSVVEVPSDVEYVIHAAATPDSREHASNPVDVMTSISEGTSAVLRAVNRVSNLKMFVHVSSGSVYAPTPDNTPVAEGMAGLALTGKLAHVYAEAKRYSEMLCVAARSQARLPMIILRPFSVCGPYQNLDSPWALNNFMADALAGRDIRILGDGQAQRSYLYGADFAVWVLLAAVCGRSGQVLNVGSPNSVCLKDLAQHIANLGPSHSRVLLNTALTGPVPNHSLVPNVHAAMQTLNVQVNTSLELALQRTWQWYGHTHMEAAA